MMAKSPKTKASTIEKKPDGGSATTKEGHMITCIAKFVSGTPGQSYSVKQILEDYLIQNPRTDRAAVNIGEREIGMVCLHMVKSGYLDRTVADDEVKYFITDKGRELI